MEWQGLVEHCPTLQQRRSDPHERTAAVWELAIFAYRPSRAAHWPSQRTLPAILLPTTASTSQQSASRAEEQSHEANPAGTPRKPLPIMTLIVKQTRTPGEISLRASSKANTVSGLSEYPSIPEDSVDGRIHSHNRFTEVLLARGSERQRCGTRSFSPSSSSQ